MMNVSAIDNINLSIESEAIKKIVASITDSLQFYDSIVTTLQAIATISEIVNLSDTVSSEILGNIQAIVNEEVNFSAGSTARVNLIATILENFSLSDGAVNYLTSLAIATDSVGINASVFWQGIQSAFVTDGLTVNDYASSAINILASVADSIQFDDYGSVIATFNIEVNDAIQFAETVAAISTLRANIADGIRITATPIEVSTLPNGKVSVSFSLQTPGVEFGMKTATIVFNLK